MFIALAYWRAVDLHQSLKTYFHDRAEVVATQNAEAVATSINAHFNDLEFLEHAFWGKSGRLLPESQILSSFIVFQHSHPGITAINIQDPSSKRIVWSSETRSTKLNLSDYEFHPIPGYPNRSLSEAVYVHIYHAWVLPMRQRIRDDHGLVLGFIGSPFVLSRLGIIHTPAAFDSMVVTDRHGRVISVWKDGHWGPPNTLLPAFAGEVVAPVPGYPWKLQVQWTEATLNHAFWSVERANIAVFLFVLSFIVGMGFWIRRLAQHNARLLLFNHLLAQIHQAIHLADDEARLLQTICDFTARLPDIRLAWIGRPDTSGRFEILAKAGPAMDYLNGGGFSTDASIPEGQGPVGKVWRDQSPWFNTFLHDQAPAGAWWPAQAERYGLGVSANLPIQRGGKMWGEFVICMADSRAMDADLQALLTGLGNDISYGLERLEERNLSKALVDYSDAGITIVRDRTLRFVNPRFAQMFGGADPKDFVGMPTRALYLNDAAYAAVGQRYAELERQGVARIEAAEFRRLDGTALLVDLFAVDSGGGKSVWTFFDVSAREAQKCAYIRLEKLYQALTHEAEVLLQADDEASILAETCSRLVEDTMFHVAWISRPGGDGTFKVLAGAGEDVRLSETLRVPLDHPNAVVAQAWRRGCTVYENDFIAAMGPGPWTGALVHGRRAASLGAPIRRTGALWGVLVLAAPQRDVFDASVVELCERIAGLLGRGLDEIDHRTELRALQSQEAERARHDALTGLPNRRALDEYLPEALARAQRQHTVVAVGLLDLDDFKLVNDRLGHAAGDVLLQQFTRALQERLRGTDFLARVGGDEFVVVLEGLEPERLSSQLQAALDRLHLAVENPFDLGEGRSASIGMTLGLALYPRDAEEPDSLLRLADAAMYQIKTHKVDRIRWWGIGTTTAETPAQEGQIDPFGAEASALLRIFDAQILEAVAVAFTEAFYGELARDPEFAQILDCFSAEELDHLKRGQILHLEFLLRPETSHEALEDSAQRTGQIHTLVGVSGAGMERAFTLYETLLREQMESTLVSARQRYRILRVAMARLRLDVQAQLAAMDRVIGTYLAMPTILPIPADTPCIDLLPVMLQTLADLPGIRHAMLLRPEADGTFRVMAGDGCGFDRLMAILERDNGPYPNLHLASGVERGPLAMAWLTREIQVVDAYQRDPRLQPWSALAQEFGWRSAATVPIGSGEQVDSVLMIFGAYPHQFSSNWARSWLSLLQNRIDEMSRVCLHMGPVPKSEQIRAYRERLYEGGLRLWYQPVVDLQSRAVVKAEALARLELADGTVLAPGQFLPAFGTQDLHILFRLGLQQALEQVHVWHQAGFEVEVAVNLPPSTLLHPEAPAWVEQALRKARVTPQYLTLEILESEELEAQASAAAIHALDALGVRLAIDDLGSGYSSLKRLASLPIDTVKIDQSLVRELPRDPVRTVRLLAALVRMGREFARHTVVEGLEDEGFVEVARRLGAPLGQGYGLARPMPGDAFWDWLRHRADVPASGDELHTWPGALVYHWMVTRDPLLLHPLQSIDTCPLTRFLRAQGIEDPDVLRWHEVVHRDVGSPAMEAASDALLQWLVLQVQATASGEPV